MTANDTAALADLVTQAPDDHEPTAAEPNLDLAGGHDMPESSSSALCRCLCSRRSQEERLSPRLRAVVPCESKAYAGKAVSSSASSTDSSHADRRGGPQEQQRSPGNAKSPRVRSETNHVTVKVVTPNGEPPQLGPQAGANIGRKTLVLDLDETLVHSSFRIVPTAEIIINVEIEAEQHPVYVLKRPGVDQFLVQVAKLYEVVVYTASMAKYANPLIDKLDVADVISFRLFREACTRSASGYVKDLSRLGRDLKKVIIIDNSPTCYAMQPENAIPINTWRDDKNDRELYDLIPILKSLAEVESIPSVLRQTIWLNEFDDDEQPRAFPMHAPKGDKRSKA